MNLKVTKVLNKLYQIKNLFILLPLMIGIIACGKDDKGPVNAELTVAEIIEQGWERFEQSNYSEALLDFEDAIARDGSIADAHNGAGWSAGKLIEGSLAQAATSFSQCLVMDTTMYDALGGWAFAAFQQGEWMSAIQKSDSLLHRRPGWRFLHDTSLDFQDIRLMTAQSYFYRLEFESCYRIITDYLNPSFETDVSTEEGRMELQQEIERLRLKYG